MSDAKTIDLLWSFRSPYCYFTLDRLMAMERDYDVTIVVRPVYPMAVRAPGFFKSINPKYRRYHTMDSHRVAEFLGVPFRRAVPDPIVQNLETSEIATEQPYIRQLTQLGAAAQRRGIGLAFLDKVARLLWDGSTDNWHEGNKLYDAIASGGIDAAALFDDVANESDALEQLIAENQQIHDESDHWGTPIMLFRGETFYGQDRIDMLRWRLDKVGIPKRP